MQHYMNSMSNGGSIASRDNQTPLTDSELAAVVPSLFATTPHESRSDRFIPIPTIDVLTALRAANFQPVFAQQARTRIPGKGDYTRHMLRMRHDSLVNTAGRAFEIILTNANDGTSAYKMFAGIFRFVCLNGLFTGDTFAPVYVRHAGQNVIESVRDGAHQILDMAPTVLGLIDEFKAISLHREEAESFARAAHLVRFADSYDSDPDDSDSRPVLDESRCPITPIQLLRVRRDADRHNTLWHALNIVQENCVKGGQRGFVQTQTGKNAGRTRRATVRAISGIGQAVDINRHLFTLAEAMAGFKKSNPES